MSIEKKLNDLLISLLDFPASNDEISNDHNFGSWIGGAMRRGEGDDILLINPATGEEFLSYCDAGSHVVAEAASAASKAQSLWWKKPPSDRARAMWLAGEKVRENIQSLAELESLSAGKPIRDCLIEVTKVAEMFSYYAGWCDKLTGDVIPVPSGHLNYTRREPYGVVTQITPWNAPIFTCGWQIAPAMCAGNGVLLKPSELTPLSSVALVKLIEEAGIPKGLINVINGYGRSTGESAILNPVTKKVVFVGSPNTAKAIAVTAAKRLIPCVLELGGKSANIVFKDADIDKAIVGAQSAIFSSAGQSCVSGSRLLVQQSIYDEFLAKLCSATKKLTIGLPWLDDTVVGPIQNDRQYQHIQSLVTKGVDEGATIAAGGCVAKIAGGEKGYFYQPTVLSNINNSMSVAQEEIFGPVVSVIPFADEEEAINIANDSRFGLAGAVWTNNIALANRVAASVNAGTFWINCYKVINVMSPFGGFGESGYGRSSGYEGLLEYTQTKSVWTDTAKDASSQFGYNN